jgi:glycosyltransferase involved in cell wall biosynthesis
MLDAWSWAAGSIGEYYPLLVAGLDGPARRELDGLLVKATLPRTVRGLPVLPLHALAALYRGCHVLFHPSRISPWGNPLRMAQACAKPVVCLETPLADALVGPAGYLIPAGDADQIGRAFGAALITVVVEEELAASLSQAARERAAAWSSRGFTHSLGDAYQALRKSGG